MFAQKPKAFGSAYLSCFKTGLIFLQDCRDPSEHEVSLIEGAQLVDWKHVDPAEVLESLPKG